MTAPVPPHPSPQAAVALLSAATFFSGAALRLCDGLIPRLAQDFTVTPGTAGQVVLSFSIAYGLLQLVFGPLADRFGKVRMIAIALAGCTLAALACALAGSFDALLLLRTAWGVFAAGVVPLSIAWIGDVVPYEERQPTLARLMMGTLSGMMAGQLAGGLFADAAPGWRGAFLAMAAGYAVVTVMLLARLRAMPATSAAPSSATLAFHSQLREVLAIPWARVVLAIALTEGVFLLGPMAYLPAYLHLRFGISVTAASALMMLYAAGGLVYGLMARRLVRRWGEAGMVVAGGALMGLGWFCFWVAPFTAAAGLIALAMGFGTYLFHNTLQTHATQMAPRLRGTSVSLFACCLFLGQAVGVSVAGLAFDHLGPAPLLLVPAAVLPLAGWAFARAVGRRARAA